MAALKNKNLLVHVDVDSPIKLLDFYQLKDVEYDEKSLENFYRVSFNRALDFFDKHHIKATFFVVANELETNSTIQAVVSDAHKAGHEIENHTYSHPFGLATLPDERIILEIKKCNEIVQKITGRSPIGFRSPGYSINSKIINILEECGFKYDSSGFWSIMNPILKNSHKLLFKNGLKNEGFGYVTSRLAQKPYLPDYNNWLHQTNTKRSLWELPLPRTSTFSLPFYNNFNLWAPSFYSNFVSKKINKPYIVYLFHMIEFMDLTDQVPSELRIHPNLKVSTGKKIKLSGRLISNLSKRYTPSKTEHLVDELSD